MNSLITYETAIARIDELHREAEQARLARTVGASLPEARVPTRRRTIWRRRPALGCGC